MLKKLFIIFLLFGSLIFTGCSTQKWLSQDELFEKKQECASYWDIIGDFLDSKYPEIDWIYVKYEISDVFFSKELNTCLYWFKAFDRLCGINNGCKYSTDYDTYVDFWIYDVLSRKEIFYKKTDSWAWVKNSEKEFNNKIKEFKW